MVIVLRELRATLESLDRMIAREHAAEPADESTNDMGYRVHLSGSPPLSWAFGNWVPRVALELGNRELGLVGT